MDESSFDEERRRIQKALNEAKKKGLAEKYGAHFSDESQLSPDGESKWLNYIEEFERQFEHANRIKIREFVGNPAFTALAFRLDSLNRKSRVSWTSFHSTTLM